MNGPQHYAEAEALLTQADQWRSEDWPVTTGERKADVLAAAQVHATLAHAAAVAATIEPDGSGKVGEWDALIKATPAPWEVSA